MARAGAAAAKSTFRSLSAKRSRSPVMTANCWRWALGKSRRRARSSIFCSAGTARAGRFSISAASRLSRAWLLVRIRGGSPSCGSDKTISIFTADDGKLERRFRAHDAAINGYPPGTLRDIGQCVRRHFGKTLGRRHRPVLKQSARCQPQHLSCGFNADGGTSLWLQIRRC